MLLVGCCMNSCIHWTVEQVSVHLFYAVLLCCRLVCDVSAAGAATVLPLVGHLIKTRSVDVNSSSCSFPDNTSGHLLRESFWNQVVQSCSHWLKATLSLQSATGQNRAVNTGALLLLLFLHHSQSAASMSPCPPCLLLSSYTNQPHLPSPHPFMCPPPTTVYIHSPSLHCKCPIISVWPLTVSPCSVSHLSCSPSVLHLSIFHHYSPCMVLAVLLQCSVLACKATSNKPQLTLGGGQFTVA